MAKKKTSKLRRILEDIESILVKHAHANIREVSKKKTPKRKTIPDDHEQRPIDF
jgi:hypothetical protein